METNRPSTFRQVLRACGAGLLSLVVWTLWLALSVAFVFQVYIALAEELPVPDFVLRRMPMQRQVHKAIETMDIYRHRPLLVIWSVLITFPVHATVVTSAMLAGMALNLPIKAPFYWVVVPVVVLSGAIPISPQGAGVMEFFAILLTKREGVTISQAFALTMSSRDTDPAANASRTSFKFSRSRSRITTTVAIWARNEAILSACMTALPVTAR